ncbi:glycosyltransferase family 4 protein [Aquiflexum lacus]|uniref:glycosyltransferase family 4 protein n=1 Tax=Aquiflexum lacus TaxID=2483805 RepID=UPI0018950858|nr:glycosyltransferase family 4 protein [Aquiflexum lacus]
MKQDIKQRRVLIMSPLPPPVGGIASWSSHVLTYLKESGYQEKYHLDTAIKFRDITDIGNLARITSGVLDAGRIVGLAFSKIWKIRPYSVHLTTSGSFGLVRDILVSLICKISKSKLIVHFRFGRIPELSQLRNWEWYMLVLLTKISNEVIVLDRKSFNALTDIKQKSNVHQIPNPCSSDLEEISKIKSNPNRNKDFVFIGHIIKEKGVFELVEAFSNFHNPPNLKLIGPVEPAIKEKLLVITKKNNQTNWLSFEGVLGKFEIFAILKTSMALILPSYSEGFPNVVLEAMACGCPVLATDVGAISEMLDFPGDFASGICFKPRDVKEIQEAVQKAIEGEVDLNHMSKMGKRKVLEAYTMESIIVEYEKIWHK